MKPRSTFWPILICLTLLAFGFVQVKQGYFAFLKKAEGLTAINGKLSGLEKQRDLLKIREVSERQEVDRFSVHLAQWKKAFAAVHDRSVITTVIPKLADEVTLVDIKSATAKVPIDGKDFPAVRVTLRAIGNYQSLIRFVGRIEESMDLAAITSLKVGSNLNEVSVQLEMLVPQFSFQ